MENALQPYVAPDKDPTKGLNEMLKSLFKQKGRPLPPEADVKKMFAFMFDWAQGFSGGGYITNLKGIEVEGLHDTIVNCDYNPYGELKEDVDETGMGYYLFTHIHEPACYARDDGKHELTEWEMESLNSWAEHMVKHREFTFPEMDPGDRNLICWAFLMYACSYEGEALYNMVDPWGEEMHRYMRNWTLDGNGSPYKWVRGEKENTLGGSVVFMDYCEIHHINYEDSTWAERSDFSTEAAWQNHLRICKTDLILIEPEEITLTGRELNECRFCGHEMPCADFVEMYRGPAERPSNLVSHVVCSHCTEKALKDGMNFGNEDAWGRYIHRCPMSFLPEVYEGNMPVEIAAKIVDDGMYHYYWGANEAPIDRQGTPNIEAKIEELKNNEPNKLRHMAAYVLMRNKCLSSRWANHPNCERIDYNQLTLWFLRIQQEDDQERMRLGTYKPRKKLM